MKRLLISLLMFTVSLLHSQEVEEPIVEESLFTTTDSLLETLSEFNLLLDDLYENSLELTNTALLAKDSVEEVTERLREVVAEFDIEKAYELYETNQKVSQDEK